MKEFYQDLEDSGFMEDEIVDVVSPVPEPAGLDFESNLDDKIELARRDLKALEVYRKQITDKIKLFERELKLWEEK
jgi:hypothetical protein